MRHGEDKIPGWWLLGLAGVIAGIVAIVFRLPSASEGFWIDELHSAWAVSGDFGQVARRASVGNQTTGYFHLLWVWRAIFGESELAMRWSSILTSALTAGGLVVAVGRHTRRTGAGLVAGLVLAVDPNGIFFGCELRPYALVMLCSFLATWSAMIWINPASTYRASFGGARWRLGMLFWICAAALIHPTSAGVLWSLVPISFVLAWRNGKLKFWRADLLGLATVLATTGALAFSSLPSSWERRGQWRAFGVATDWWQLWYAWSWLPLLLVPTGIAILAWALKRLWLGEPQSVPSHSLWWLPGLVGLIGTVTFFVASYFDFVPLWHRRYFVAALPLLAWSTGAATAEAALMMPPRLRWSVGWQRGCVVVCGIVVVGMMVWYQGMWPTLCNGELPVLGRGEGWRELVQQVHENRKPNDAVWLDTGLIEDQFLRDSIEKSGGLETHDWGYLSFPVSGPYRVDDARIVSVYEHESWLRVHLAGLRDTTRRIWLISRSRPEATERFADRVGRVVRKTRFGSLGLVEIEIHSGGGGLLSVNQRVVLAVE